MSAERRRPRARRGSGRGRRILGLFGWLLLLIGSLGFVVWRQGTGVTMEAEVRAIEAEHAIAEAERMESLRRIQAASSRARVVRVARDRLGMHLPSDGEILLLPVPAAAAGAAPAERAGL